MDTLESACNLSALYCSLEMFKLFYQDYFPNSYLRVLTCTYGKNEVWYFFFFFFGAGDRASRCPLEYFFINPTQLLVNDFHLSPWLANLISCKHSHLIYQQVKRSQGKQRENPLFISCLNIFRASDSLCMNSI